VSGSEGGIGEAHGTHPIGGVRARLLIATTLEGAKSKARIIWVMTG
jgi:hypothetical protein